MILIAVFLIIYGLMGFGVYFGPAIFLLNLVALAVEFVLDAAPDLGVCALQVLGEITGMFVQGIGGSRH